MQRYEARLIGNCWFLVDTVNNVSRVCRSREEAEDRAWRYSNLLRVVEQRRSRDEATFQRLLAERMKLPVEMTNAKGLPAVAAEQMTTA